VRRTTGAGGARYHSNSGMVYEPGSVRANVLKNLGQVNTEVHKY